eukprot:CAMPEP_0206222908 /NCGR_PEP_ID=MMETSP0047_2-20121206/6208_1 /ASSEMBLY_ACC=CAM_ASM_000192 /TAXON_ID=195065 /ORGANISM="Chroomonas mesostigmatica_cf, Strain CCMP1168" /LENGTH=33 /DNA_ID= /DNA_START= /DNA_END= /DNA_ORIENTATION=
MAAANTATRVTAAPPSASGGARATRAVWAQRHA